MLSGLLMLDVEHFLFDPQTEPASLAVENSRHVGTSVCAG